MAKFRIWERTIAYRSCIVEADSPKEAERIWSDWPNSSEKLFYADDNWTISDGEEIDEIEEI